MGSRRANTPPEDDRWAQATSHIAALEDRLRILEAKVRELSASLRTAAPTEAQKKQARRAARARPRPRCPGCTLELPKGFRSESCVWCGFMLTAVRARTLR